MTRNRVHSPALIEMLGVTSPFTSEVRLPPVMLNQLSLALEAIRLDISRSICITTRSTSGAPSTWDGRVPAGSSTISASAAPPATWIAVEPCRWGWSQWVPGMCSAGRDVTYVISLPQIWITSLVPNIFQTCFQDLQFSYKTTDWLSNEAQKGSTEIFWFLIYQQQKSSNKSIKRSCFHVQSARHQAAQAQ